jgi:hypothetical protein
MHEIVISLFWFVLALLVLGSIAWFCGLVPAGVLPAARDRVDPERERFEAYWADRNDIANKAAAWSAWRERGASSGQMTAAEILASLFGILGASLLAYPGVHPAWGFAAFLVSNLAAIPFNKRQGHRWILMQQCIYLLSSLAGLWNWWLGPLVLG